jgi:serine/threonine protein kinase
MGEVYRAEDLKLTQTVALKFLPVALTENEAARERFHLEVRLAREIAHPNVCRVFDIGEFQGRLFLTMEYVDGEDLSSLLRRIGQFPQAKAVEMARQICAGLAAAHEHGVLHRDLKPGNIMLDGRGRVRITDFGLAGFVDQIAAEELHAGTPAYMAPEQLAGTEATKRSDIYSLGLVLYEIFSGKKAFDAATLPELLRLRERTSPASISTLVRDIDPLIERVILRCLERDPGLRPATALQVASALPGGDPLAAALAAGETPSPEMVAAAGEKDSLRPALAWAFLAIILGGVAASAILNDKRSLLNAQPPLHSAPVLAARAREVLSQLGYRATPNDVSYGFGLFQTTDYIRYVSENNRSADRWRDVYSGVPPLLTFWYRESPRPFEVNTFELTALAVPDDPPNSQSGMLEVFLDPAGRLLWLEARPPQREQVVNPPRPNWNGLFLAAGLELEKFEAVTPEWTPTVGYDTRGAWQGTWPGHPNVPLRVEAAMFAGRPVFFQLVFPWTTADQLAPDQRSTTETIQMILLALFLTVVTGFGIRLARQNVKAGRSDRRGAFRVSVFVFVLNWIAGVLFAHHTVNSHEAILLFMITALSLLIAASVWVLYVALEPHVRRRWPNSLISWSRVLSGQLRDTIVGRDILLGISAGLVWAIILRSAQLLPPLLGKPPLAPVVLEDYIELVGLHYTVADILLNILLYILFALVLFFIFFCNRLMLRWEWLAVIVTAVMVTGPDLLGSGTLASTLLSAAIFAAALLLLIRFGLLALVIAFTLRNILLAYPLTARLSAWYAEPTIVVFLLILAGAAFGLYTSTAGRALFSPAAIDESLR